MDWTVRQGKVHHWGPGKYPYPKGALQRCRNGRPAIVYEESHSRGLPPPFDRSRACALIQNLKKSVAESTVLPSGWPLKTMADSMSFPVFLYVLTGPAIGPLVQAAWLPLAESAPHAGLGARAGQLISLFLNPPSALLAMMKSFLSSLSSSHSVEPCLLHAPPEPAKQNKGSPCLLIAVRESGTSGKILLLQPSAAWLQSRAPTALRCRLNERFGKPVWHKVRLALFSATPGSK